MTDVWRTQMLRRTVVLKPELKDPQLIYHRGKNLLLKELFKVSFYKFLQ